MLQPLEVGHRHISQGRKACSAVHVPPPAAAPELSEDAIRAHHRFLQQLHDHEVARLTVNGTDE